MKKDKEKKKSKILIVEDDEEIHTIYKNILEKKYSLVLVTNTEEAKKVLDDQKIDLMILDLILPKESGEVFFEKIKRQKRFKNLKVIAITVLGDVSDFFKKIDPDSECLPKPFDKKKLLAIVDKMIA